MLPKYTFIVTKKIPYYSADLLSLQCESTKPHSPQSIIVKKILIMDKKILDKAADNIRILAASMVEKAKSGHPGGAMGGADFINVLFSEYLVFDPDRKSVV